MTEERIPLEDLDKNIIMIDDNGMNPSGDVSVNGKWYEPKDIVNALEIVNRLREFNTDIETPIIYYLEELFKLETNSKYPTYKIDTLCKSMKKWRELQKIMKSDDNE